MAGTTRRDRMDILSALRQRPVEPAEGPRGRFPEVLIRRINVAFTSIVEADLRSGEIVFNDIDDTLVVRIGQTIYKWANGGSRAI